MIKSRRTQPGKREAVPTMGTIVLCPQGADTHHLTSTISPTSPQPAQGAHMSAEPIEVVTVVTEILAEEAGVDATTITRDTDLAKDLDIDSLGLLTVATQIEERYPITLEDSLLTKLVTVGQLVDLVCDAQA